MAEPVDTVLKSADEVEARLELTTAEAAGWRIIDSLPDDVRGRLLNLIDNDAA